MGDNTSVSLLFSRTERATPCATLPLRVPIDSPSQVPSVSIAVVHLHVLICFFPRALGRTRSENYVCLVILSQPLMHRCCYTNECAAHMKHTSVSTVTCNIKADMSVQSPRVHARAITGKTKTPPKARTRKSPLSNAPAVPAGARKNRAK